MRLHQVAQAADLAGTGWPVIPGCRVVNYQGLLFHSPDITGRVGGMHHGHDWIDLLIGTLIVLGTLIGWRRGVLSEFPALVALLASLWLATRLYPFASQWLAGVTDWRAAWTKPLGFLLILCAGLLSQRWLYVGLISRLPPQVHRHPINRLLGIAPGAAHGFVQAVIVAALLIALPLPQKWQTQTQESALNARFAGYADALNAMLRPVFADAIDETLTMLTMKPSPC